MVIEVVIFFAWVFLVVVIGGVISWTVQRRRQLKLQSTENVENERALSFPQRHWLLLCVAVAIISPLLVNGISAEAHHKLHRQSNGSPNGVTGVNPPRPDSSASGSLPKDTTYHVATPPQH
ncbi:MAG TPA: hypothetical protein VFE32_18125 [Puia sp.]|jgi:hypothetical protein|nr:hypothetical protein [Puia sp.]